MKLVSVILVALLLAGCGQASVSRTVSESVENGEQKTFPEENVTENTLLEGSKFTDAASDIFATVTGISEEWQDGLYVINGRNSTDDMVCGIMNDERNVEVFDEYTALFPLADGHLIATTDTTVDGNLWFDGQSVVEYSAGISGRIINQNGDVIYQQEENQPLQRMYYINPHRILVMAANPSFDGIELSWGVLNQNGEWIYPLKNEPNDLLEMVQIEDDGIHWSLGSPEYNEHYVGGAIKVYRSALTDNGENHVLQFQMRNGTEIVCYNEKTNKWSSYVTNSFATETSKGLRVVSGGLYPEGVEFFDDGEQCAVLLGDKRSDRVGIIGESSENNVYLTYTEFDFDLNKWETSFYDDKENQIIFPEKYVEKRELLRLYDDRFVFVLNGADDMCYIAVTDLQGNTLVEPTILPFEGNGIEMLDVKDNLVVCGDESIIVVDLETGVRVGECHPNGYSTDGEVRFIGGNMFVTREFREGYGECCEVFQIDGSKLIG